MPPAPRLDRRTALKWMLTTAASLGVPALAARDVLPATGAPPSSPPPTPGAPAAAGYGTDPALNRDYRPGEFWPLTFDEPQRRAATALCALLIPAEGATPGAAEVGVPDFLDEWISAPYPEQQKDRPLILAGLAWIDAEARRRFGRDFADLAPAQAAALADDICHAPDAPAGLAEGARFFARFRDLTAGGYFSTPVGMKELGYVGNTPLAEFKGPPPEVLRHLGLA